MTTSEGRPGLHLRVLDVASLVIRGDVQHDRPPLKLGTADGDGDIFADRLRRPCRLEPRAGRHDNVTLRDALQVERVGFRRVAGQDDHRVPAPHAVE